MLQPHQGVTHVTIAALIVAAGRGTRALAPGSHHPKQYVELAGRCVLTRTLDCFLTHPGVACTLVVIHPDDRSLYDTATAGLAGKLLPAVFGGATRQDSVRNGLTALSQHGPASVLIHDAARPFVQHDLIDRVIHGLGQHDGVVAAVPLADTLKRAGTDGSITGTVDRGGLWRAQTPQGFHFGKLLAAHQAAHGAGRNDFTDDAAVAEYAGLSVNVVPGSERNIKLTTPEDIAMAEHALSAPGTSPREVRTGQGFDVHRLVPGDHVWLCGLRIPHTASLEGHSDADVGLHALTDAILGAIGAGDIGQHFPPSDQRWKGAPSHVFLRHAADLLAARGGRISNVDVTILAEAPRIAPHRERMCARIAEILGLSIERVSVKATTTEQLGFTGRREGIAAMAVATVTLPAC